MIRPRRHELATQALRLAWMPPMATTLANSLKQTWPPRPATFDLTSRGAVLSTSPVSFEHSIRPGASAENHITEEMRTGEKLGVGPKPARRRTACLGRGVKLLQNDPREI